MTAVIAAGIAAGALLLVLLIGGAACVATIREFYESH